MTEQFLKICLQFMFVRVIQSEETSVSNAIVLQILNAIKEIIDFYKEKEDGIPLYLNELTDLVYYCTNKLMERNTSETDLKSLILTSDYKVSPELESYIKYISDLQLDINDYLQLAKHITYKLKYVTMFKEYNKLMDFMKEVEENKIPSMEEAVAKYESILNSVYFDFSLNKQKLIDEQQLINNKSFPREIVTKKENIEELVRNMLDSKRNSKTVCSGFKTFDTEFSNGGFEPGRIYILTGVSGFGKSMWMLSSAVKSAEFYDMTTSTPSGKKHVYLFITAENQIYETLSRYITMRLNITEKDLSKWTDKDIIKNVKKLTFKNSVLKFRYVSPYTTTVGDIMVIIEQTLAEFPPEEYELKALYIDYLDLIKPIQQTDLYRLELGYTTMELKEVGIRYSIPVITLTQMNDYEIDSGEKYKTPRLSILTESRKKVENADTIMVLHQDVDFALKTGLVPTEEELHGVISVIKNRGYKKGKFGVYINYDYRKFVCKNIEFNVDDRSEYLQSYIAFYRSMLKNKNKSMAIPHSNKVATFESPNIDQVDITETDTVITTESDTNVDIEIEKHLDIADKKIHKNLYEF